MAAAPYFFRRVDEEIRRSIEARIAQHYPGLKVIVGSAELVSGQGIKVRDLSILEPAAEGPRAELISVEEMFLTCQTDVKELICREPAVTHVTLRRPTVRVTRRLDGTWSAAGSSPAPLWRPVAGNDRRKRHHRNFRSPQNPCRHPDSARPEHDCNSRRPCRCGRGRQAKRARHALRAKTSAASNFTAPPTPTIPAFL